KEGMLLRDNVYGTIDEDAERRDFTINAMYYNIADYSIHDYAGGVEDLEDRLVRLIGDPETRYREDPVRMLRAIRFAAKLDFDIEEDTAAPIEEMAYLLRDIPAARLYEESLKLLQSGHGLETYHLMREYNLFQQMFPAISAYFTEDYSSKAEQMLDLVLDSTDIRVEEGKRINPAYMFAAMLWYPLLELADKLMDSHNLCHYDAVMEASNLILDEQVRSIAIPRRHTATIREIWQLQLRLPRRNGKRAFRLMELNKFRAGFDFLEMRGEIEGGETATLAKWWGTFQNAGREMRLAMVNDLEGPAGSSKSGRKRRSFNKKKSKAKS
ncbi:poly(A) polymerase, partial [Vibrio vulnificus]